jgi:hypothetical protein
MIKTRRVHCILIITFSFDLRSQSSQATKETSNISHFTENINNIFSRAFHPFCIPFNFFPNEILFYETSIKLLRKIQKFTKQLFRFSQLPLLKQAKVFRRYILASRTWLNF